MEDMEVGCVIEAFGGLKESRTTSCRLFRLEVMHGTNRKESQKIVFLIFLEALVVDLSAQATLTSK